MIARRVRTPFLAVVGLTALVSGCGVGSVTTGETRTERVSLDVGDATSARIELRMGAGELNVGAGAQKLAEATFRYNVSEWKPLVDHRTGATAELKITQPGSTTSFGNTVNDWDITLNDGLPIELSANLGAGEANLNLGRMNLSRVNVNIGAGEMEMDLRGAPKRSYDVQIRGGVGKTVVHLPTDVGVAATATKGIGALDIKGLEQRDGVWVNPEHVGGPVTIRLDVKGGVGEIRLVR